RRRHSPRMPSNQSTRLKQLGWIPATLVAVVLGTAPPLQAERLTRQTEEAFDRYIRASEARMDQEVDGRGGFLWIDALPQPSRDQAHAELRNRQGRVGKTQSR